jgi:hypothetical protein
VTEVGTAAGWYGDPHSPARLRYHDGAEWTEHTRVRRGASIAEAYDGDDGRFGTLHLDGEAPVPASAVPDFEPAAGVTGRLSGYRERERAMRTANPLAYAGATIAIVGLLFNPFAVTSGVALLLSLAGLPIAIVQERRGLRYNGRATALIGIGVALAGGALLLVRAALTGVGPFEVGTPGV